jgi:hypothetical protein
MTGNQPPVMMAGTFYMSLSFMEASHTPGR